MADNSFHDFVRELFEGLGPIQIKRMFGGAGGFSDGGASWARLRAPSLAITAFTSGPSRAIWRKVHAQLVRLFSSRSTNSRLKPVIGCPSGSCMLKSCASKVKT